MFRRSHFCLFSLLLLYFTTLLSCRDKTSPVALTSGMHLTQSVTIERDTFVLEPQGSDFTVLTISGDNLIIDFNGAVLLSAANPQNPTLFWGTGIRILDGKNIQIKNVKVHGFKVGLLATNCDSLQLMDSDFSYNYRPHLPSAFQQENREDHLAFRQNNQADGESYGAAIYLKHCDLAMVKNVQVIGGQNGLVLDNCQRGLFYNNTIQYNSGIGIGLYRSNHNRVMHNRLDWNTRGDSTNSLKDQQGAAGIFAYGPISDNVIAYNSATHCSLGFSLSTGHPSLTNETGASNNNLVFGNDFSPTSSQEGERHSGVNNTLEGEDAPAPLADGQSTLLPEGSPRGRQYILMTEWGPYDFRYPSLWLRSVEGNTYTFVILGPQGNWQLVGGTGIEQVSRKRGAVPATVVVQGAEGLSLEMKFIGAEAHTVFGESVKKGKEILFGWR